MTLIITLGPPGCGKTTSVDRWWEEDPMTRVRLSRDGLRTAIGAGGDHDSNPPEVEYAVTLGQRGAIAAWLAAGLDVAVDDTCQHQWQVDGWDELARGIGVVLMVWDYRAVPMEICDARVAARMAAGGRPVEPEAIRLVAGRCAEIVIPHGAAVTQMGDPVA